MNTSTNLIPGEVLRFTLDREDYIAELEARNRELERMVEDRDRWLAQREETEKECDNSISR